MSPRSDRQRLRDIVEAIAAIRSHEQLLDEKGVGRDQRVRLDAVVRQLAILGEAVASIDDEVLAGEPDIPWEDIAGMRIILDHRYFDEDAEVVWDTVDRDLDGLQDAAQRLIEHERP